MGIFKGRFDDFEPGELEQQLLPPGRLELHERAAVVAAHLDRGDHAPPKTFVFNHVAFLQGLRSLERGFDGAVLATGFIPFGATQSFSHGWVVPLCCLGFHCCVTSLQSFAPPW